MESSWLYAVLNAVNKAAADKISIPLLVLTLLISFFVSKALRYSVWPKAILTILVWLVWPVILLLMIKIQLFPALSFADGDWLRSIPHAFSQIFNNFEPALLIILGTAVLWWMGRRLSYCRPDFSTVVTEFQFGMIILVVTFFSAYQLNLDQSASLPVILIFFSLALIGISISNAQNNTWFNSRSRGPWSGILALSIGVVLLLGILVSVIITPDLLQILLNVLGWLWGIIEKILAFLAGLFPQESVQSPLPIPTVPGVDNQTDTGFKFPEWIVPGFRLAYSILVGGIVLFTIYRITSDILKWIKRRTSSTGGEVESLRGAFWADLTNWLKRIIFRIFGFIFRRNLKKKSIIPAEIASVRQLYAQLLSWGAKKGFKRQKGQTPIEYRNMLIGIIPENREELEFITEQYMEARYGCAFPKEEKLNRLKQVWEKLRKVDLKKCLRARSK
jgi:hypothetical protein